MEEFKAYLGNEDWEPCGILSKTNDPRALMNNEMSWGNKILLKNFQEEPKNSHVFFNCDAQTLMLWMLAKLASRKEIHFAKEISLSRPSTVWQKSHCFSKWVEDLDLKIHLHLSTEIFEQKVCNLNKRKKLQWSLKINFVALCVQIVELWIIGG